MDFYREMLSQSSMFAAKMCTVLGAHLPKKLATEQSIG